MHSLTVIKRTLVKKSLNITSLLQTTISHTNFFFKTIMNAAAMVIIKQTVCIATALTLWEMWTLPENEAF